MKSRVRMMVRGSLLASLVLGLASVSQAGTLKQGDVVLGIGGGQVRVFRPGTGVVIDTISDGVGGATNALANDNTWHLLTADAGSGTLSTVVRFAITHPHGALTPTFNGSTCPSTPPPAQSTNVQSMVINGNGHIFLANASPASVVELGVTGNCVQAFPLAGFIDAQLASIDLSGNTIYFTSGGKNIGQLNLLNGAVSTFSLTPGSLNLFGIRVLPGGTLPSSCNGATCPTSGSFLFAAGDRVVLVNSAFSIVATYTISGQSNLRVLALDPVVVGSQHQFFYVADPNSTGNFFRVNVSNGHVDTFNANTLKTGSDVSAILSLTTYGSFSPNQPVPMQVTGVGDLSPGDTETFSAFSNTLTMTNYGTVSTIATVFASAIDSTTGSTDSGSPCTKTTPSASPTACVVWETDFNPLPADNTIAVDIVTPTGLEDANTHLFENEAVDETLGVANIDTTGRKGISCLFSLNEVGGKNGQCAYFTPLDSGTNFNNPGNITFRFSCSNLTSTELTTLQNSPPFLDIVQLNPPTAPKPFFPGITQQTGGTGNPVNQYRTGSGNTFTQNVNFKGVTGCFLATTLDFNNSILSAFDVVFGVNLTGTALTQCPIGVLTP